MKTLAAILLAGLGISATEKVSASDVAFTDHCAGMSFRETPYTDMRCTRRLAPDAVAGIKHFQMDYDVDGRLLEVRYQQDDELRAYSDRFVRAPKITIEYEDGLEIRKFYNEWGHRTLVSGDVYEARFTLDDRGQRTGLQFYGLNGQVINNDFGIARYSWQLLDDGEVIEHRYNTAGEIVRNRPGFGYMVTRFAFDAHGLLTRMYNLGADGKALTPDDAGIAMTKIGYDHNGQFNQWLNLDMDGQAKRGMSDIAEIVYVPSKFSGEGVAIFNDADGSPQTTRWGAHKVVLEFDRHGNTLKRSFFGVDGKPTESTSGLGHIVATWSPGGVYQLSERYLDKGGKPAASSFSGVHAIITELGANGRPASISFQDLGGDVIDHKGSGYAVERFEYDSRGRLIVRSFETADGAPADHGTWGVARFEYGYDSEGGLTSVRSVTAAGEAAEANWDPVH